jgi:hypothetical protein
MSGGAGPKARRTSGATHVTEPDVHIDRLAVDDDPGAIFAALLRDGVVIIERFLTAAQVAALNTAADPYNETADPLMRNVYDFGVDPDAVPEPLRAVATTPDLIENGFRSGNTRNVTGLSTKLPTFVDDVLLHPMYAELCDRLLKPHCIDYVLNHSHLINVGPGARAQPLHRDEGIWRCYPGLGVGSHLQFASIVALVDFTEENGATNVVPGSHLWEGLVFETTAGPSEIALATMAAGSAVVYLGWTFHGAGQNRTSDVWRRGLHVSFCQGWLRTEETNTLATPPEVARHLPVRAQELLGYGVHGGLGQLELRSPIDQMRDGVL